MFASLFAKTQAQPQRNYSRLVIISDFHYPCKNLVPPKERLMRMAAKERVLQEMNDWRDLDLAVFTGDMVQRNGDAAEYRLVRLVVNGLKKRKAFIAGNHELLYTGHHANCALGAARNGSSISPAIPRPSAPFIMPGSRADTCWSSYRLTP